MIKIIVAVDKNGAIGRNNDLIYNIREDLKNFKKLTTDNIIVMGRNTWETLPIKPLPNRENVVLTTNDIKLDKATVLNSMNELKKYLSNSEKDVYIIGGASIYNQIMDEKLVDEAHVTFVRDEVKDADTFISIDKLKSILPKEEYIKTFEQDGIQADYIVLTK